MQNRRRAPLKRPAVLFAWVTTAVLVSDQLAKTAVRAAWGHPAAVHPLDRWLSGTIEPSMRARQSIPVVGDWLQISFVRNQGAAFGLLPGQRTLFIITSLTVLALLLAYWFRAKPRSAVVVSALALAVAGAVGNLIDRVLIGNVTDFIDVAIIDFPVFNIADSAIFIGASVLVVWLLFVPEHHGESQDAAVEGTVG